MYQKLAPAFDYIFGGASGVPNQNLYQIPSLNINTPTIGTMPEYNQVRAANYMPVSGQERWSAATVANQPIGSNPGAQFQPAPAPRNPTSNDPWPNVKPNVGVETIAAAINPYLKATSGGA